MAQYPNLAEVAFPEDAQPANDDHSDSTSDDDDCSTDIMEGFTYDDHGELVPVAGDGPSQPVISTAPEIHPPSRTPKPPMTSKTQTFPGKQDVVVPRGPRGKLGVKFTRMGSRIFFSYVEMSSSAAKCGLGFGDELLAIKGYDIRKLSGTRLMSALARSPDQQFTFTVLFRPYDFILNGLVTPQMELHYYTRQGKLLGSIPVCRLAKSGYIRNLKLLCVDEHRVFSLKEHQLTQVFQTVVGKNLVLRVMPAQLYTHLTRRQDKEQLRHNLQLSPRIL